MKNGMENTLKERGISQKRLNLSIKETSSSGGWREKGSGPREERNAGMFRMRSDSARIFIETYSLITFSGGFPNKAK